MGGHLLDERKGYRQWCRVPIDPAVGYDPNEAGSDKLAQCERFNVFSHVAP
jgi:hypothetical protein